MCRLCPIFSHIGKRSSLLRKMINITKYERFFFLNWDQFCKDFNCFSICRVFTFLLLQTDNSWTNLSWQDEPWAEFSILKVAACHAMHFLRSIVIRPNLELKTRPKQLLGSLPLDVALPRQLDFEQLYRICPVLFDMFIKILFVQVVVYLEN